jgi:predicted transglutaminase-like cysteine proteinase
MAHLFDVIVSGRVAAIAIGVSIIAAAGPIQAIPRARAVRPIFTAVVEKAKPPNGWAEFCARYRSDCDVKPSTPRDIRLDSKTWNKIVNVNRWVNRHIVPMTDRRHWGRLNKWYYAEDGRGDCKAYVLMKRKKLIEAGLPREALLITTVWSRQTHGHAVLIARTDKGDYVLDNLSRRVVLWSETGYDFVERQSQSDPNAWVYIDGDPRQQPVTAAGRIDDQ